MYKKITKEVISLCLNKMNKHIVKDQCYGSIVYNGFNFQKIKRKRSSKTKRERSVIIIVLESPHVKEFNKNTRYPLVNDKLFLKYFDDCLNGYIRKTNTHLFKKERYDVILMNSIQYQCSLGFTTKKYRDIVFLTLWEFLHFEFECRLKSLINSNKVAAVINFVTKGDHSKLSSSKLSTCKNISTSSVNNIFFKEIGSVFKNSFFNSLNDIVDDSILKVINNNIVHIRGNHPSSWHSKKNRNLY